MSEGAIADRAAAAVEAGIPVETASPAGRRSKIDIGLEIAKNTPLALVMLAFLWFYDRAEERKQETQIQVAATLVQVKDGMTALAENGRRNMEGLRELVQAVAELRREARR